MTAVQIAPATARSVPGRARTVHDVADLALIFEPGVNIVVLRRAVPEDPVGEVQSALHDRSFKVLEAVAPDAFGRGEILAGLADSPSLARDVQSWIELLAELTGSDRIGVRVAATLASSVLSQGTIPFEWPLVLPMSEPRERTRWYASPMPPENLESFATSE